MITALIPCGWDREDKDFLKVFDIRGYSHCGPVREYYSSGLGEHAVCKVFFKRRGIVALDTELRRKKIYAHQIKEG